MKPNFRLGVKHFTEKDLHLTWNEFVTIFLENRTRISIWWEFTALPKTISTILEDKNDDLENVQKMALYR